jgi:sigma-B regulation protein RsbU (phosphoserine phosphatase)
MISESDLHALLVDQVSQLITGTVFLIVGLVTLAVAVIRRRSGGARAVFWVGIWSAIYGMQRLNDCPAITSLLPYWLQKCIPYSHAFITYLTLVAGAFTFRELSRGKVRQFLGVVVLTGLVIATLGVGRFVLSGDENGLIRYNHLLASVTLIVLLAFILFPALGPKYGALELGGRRGVLLVGSLIFGFEALYSNVARFGHPFDTRIWDDLGFAALLLSLGYVAMHRVYSGELRLSSIENELAIARQLQFAILPATTPALRNLRVAAAYEPMSAVAGDFYEFLPVDEYRSGFLVADVSGHGVPAALIASMIKLAAKSVTGSASNPSELLRRLRETLSGQLQGQFVSVAYLWIDTETRRARYSAAGHPPLMFWHAADGSLDRITSNGTLIGVPFETDYPVCEFSVSPGDRFLLYTDGVSEPENETGEAFGDRRLEQLLHENESLPAAEFSLQLLAKVRAWQPASTPQQDDITILVIDVL